MQTRNDQLNLIIDDLKEESNNQRTEMAELQIKVDSLQRQIISKEDQREKEVLSLQNERNILQNLH